MNGVIKWTDISNIIQNFKTREGKENNLDGTNNYRRTKFANKNPNADYVVERIKE